MSNSIRDLIVSIDFSDINISQLIQVDSALDEIEDQLQAMGHEINDASHEFSQMGTEALIAAGIAENALESVEDAAEDAKKEVDDLSFAFVGATLKAVALGVAWTAAAAGAVAAAAPLLVVAGGLAASAAAAAAGMAAYGAVALPVLTGVFEKEKEIEGLQKKLAQADTAKERIKAQKALKEAMKGVSKEEKFALKELSSFKKFWGGFTDSFKPEILNQFGTGLHIIKELFKGLKPTIKAVSGVITEILETMDQNISNGGLKGFFEWLETNGAESLRNFATIGGNLIGGFFSILQSFSPIGASMEEGLVGLTEKFKIWADGLSSNPAFQNFVDYAMANGPVLWSTLGNIWDVLVDIVQAAAPLGTEVLNALQWLTDKAAELSPKLSGVSDAMMSLITGVKDNWGVIKEILIPLGTFIGLLAAWRAGTLLVAAAQTALNIVMGLSPITWVILGIAALIAIGVALYRNWDTIKAKMGELWAKTKEFFGKIGNWIITTMQPVIDFFGRLKAKWDEFVSALKNFKMPKIGIPKMFGGNGLIQKADGSHATGLSRVPFDGYRALLHKDEAVLTAKQSDALRAAGILDTGGKKPSLNAGANVTPTGRSKGGSVFSPTISIQVNGASGDAKEIGKQAALAARKELEKLFTQLGMAFE